MHSLTEKYTIRTSEVDQYKQLTIPALLRLCMETAMQHAQHLNVSVWTLEQEHMAWVLSRLYILPYHLPGLGNQILIKTQPSGYDRLFTYRDFEIYAEDGQLLAECATSWIMFDLDNRKRIPLPLPVKEILDRTSKSNPLPRPEVRLKLNDQMKIQKTYEVGYYHLDFNGHMSNLYYPEWILEPLGKDWIQHRRLTRLDISYLSECNYGEKVFSSIFISDSAITWHQLTGPDDRIILSAKAQWSSPE